MERPIKREKPGGTVRYFTSFLVTVCVFVSGCAVNPVTGESELSLISPQQEIAIGKQNYQPSIQSQGGEYVVDPALERYVSRIGQKMVPVSHRPELPYEFTVINNDTPNAWALPGGKIAINRGLLTHLDNEAQLAAVLGHEIAHVTARHSASQMSRGALLQIGTQVVGQASQGSGYGGLVAMGAGLGAAAWQAKYGREDELESDRLGMEYMTQVGYEPQAAVELQQTFVELSKNQSSDFITGLFASHPPSQERVAANRQRAQNLPGSTRNRDAYRQATAQLRKDQDAYTAHQKAITALQNNRQQEAMTQVQKAIDRQPKENHFWETKAHLHVLQKQTDQARQAFSRAIELNPGYFSPYLGRGALLQQAGELEAAEQDLLASRERLNTPTANYLLGQVNLQQGERQQAIEYFKVAASAGGEVGQAAQRQLQELGVPREQEPRR